MPEMLFVTGTSASFTSECAADPRVWTERMSSPTTGMIVAKSQSGVWTSSLMALTFSTTTPTESESSSALPPLSPSESVDACAMTADASSFTCMAD